MAFVAVKYELTNFIENHVSKFRQQGKNSSQWDRHLAAEGDKVETDEDFSEMEGILEMKYLRYCDPSQPLQLMTMLMTRSSMNTIRFLTHHPRRWANIDQTPLPERQWVWEVSIKILEQHNMLQSNPQLRQFAWYAASFMQWHTFIHVLETLWACPLIADAEKAWELIGNKYKYNPAMVFDMKKPIHVAVGSLCLKAYDARAAALQPTNNMGSLQIPELVVKLREQQEASMIKKHAGDAKTSEAEDRVFHTRARARDLALSPDNYNSEYSHVHQRNTTTTHSLNLAQTDGSADMLFINGFDDSHVGDSTDLRDANPGFTPTQDLDIADRSKIVDWEQWDT